MTCAYCEKDVRPIKKGIYKRGKLYHVECFIAWTHDLAKVIQSKAEAIVDCTQSNNAKANNLAHKIIQVAEQLL